MRSLLFGTLLCVTLFTACQKSSTTAPDNNNTITDSATVTVVNGYGSGKYKVGDTVNIWSTAIPDNAVFDSWTGITNLLQNSGEWHNSFVMPAQNVTVTGSTKASVTYTLQYEKIKGVNILKNVYYYFPASPKGIAFLLHGTGGSAQNIANNYDWILMMRDLVNAGFAVVVTEAEEISLATDTNGDGKLRWQTLPLDSTTSVDYGNIKAIRDTFYARGYANPGIPQYAIGMSNGGAFSCSLSSLYKFKSGIAYCAQGFQIIFNTSVIPFQFCMAKYDNNDEVGAKGDADALTYSQLLTGRGVCSKYFLQDKSPVYPERFARRSDISIKVSTAFFNELKTNHWMDAKNYMTITADSLASILSANPTTYPTYKSFNVSQRVFVTDQIDEMYAAHHFFSDLNKTTIKFLTSQCQ